MTAPTLPRGIVQRTFNAYGWDNFIAWSDARAGGARRVKLLFVDYTPSQRRTEQIRQAIANELPGWKVEAELVGWYCYVHLTPNA